MALNGSVSVEATPNGRDMLVFSWEAVQDSAAMASTVSWKLELVADAYGALDVTDSEIYPWAVTLDGQAFSGNSNIFIGANETVTLATGEAVLAHDADGTKSFEFSFMQDFCGLVWSGETEINEVSGSGTGELDPLTVEETPKKFDIKGFLIGLAMALCAPARQFPQREPVAFLYNGVRLPDIYTVYTPEVQTEKPHVFIMEYEINGMGLHYRMATLYAIPKVEYFKADNGNWCVSTANGCKTWKIQVSLTGDASANDYVGKEWEAIEDTSSFSGIVTSEIDWANFDVLNEDGTLCLDASWPIPVYE